MLRKLELESPKKSTRRHNTTKRKGGSSGVLCLGGWFVLALTVTGSACVVVGTALHGFSWEAVLRALWITGLGVASLAVAVFEFEWLERVVTIVKSGYWGLLGILNSSWTETLSESDLLGPKGARTVWFFMGISMFVVGCFLGLHIIEF